MTTMFEVRQGDCVELMATMPAGSVDAVVCDPPAGIGFMGRMWDHHRGGRNEWVEWMVDVLREALRVCKPGAHAFVWSLPRTSHWTGSALEMAGWEVRDVVSHMFGSGFPKSHNLPNGYGTALKPAAEFWWLARKPLSGTVAGNVLEHGVGALNVDGCRVGFASNGDQETAKPGGRATSKEGGDASKPDAGRGLERQGFERGDNSSGRWPANVVLSHTEGCVQVGTRKVKSAGWSDSDVAANRAKRAIGDFKEEYTGKHYAGPDGTETVGAWSCTPDCAVRLLDEQTGETTSSNHIRHNTNQGHEGWSGTMRSGPLGSPHCDTGGASRFFPTFDNKHEEAECISTVKDATDVDVSGPVDTTDGDGGSVDGVRFRYVAKASRGERSAGLTGPDVKLCICPDPPDPEPSPPKGTSELAAGDASDSSTTGNGSKPTGPSHPDTTSTTSTGSRPTTDSPTLSSSPPSTTSESTPPTTAATRLASGSDGAKSAASGNPPMPSTTTSASKDGPSMVAVDPATSVESSATNSGARCASCGGVVQGALRNSHPT